MERDRQETEQKTNVQTRKFTVVKNLDGHRPTAAFLAALNAVISMARNET